MPQFSSADEIFAEIPSCKKSEAILFSSILFSSLVIAFTISHRRQESQCNIEGGFFCILKLHKIGLKITKNYYFLRNLHF